jgi:hypothetical protein
MIPKLIILDALAILPYPGADMQKEQNCSYGHKTPYSEVPMEYKLAVRPSWCNIVETKTVILNGYHNLLYYI